MKVLIVGLGLIGGAYALRLKNKGYTVYGSDINEKALEFAMKNNYIDYGSLDSKDFISEVNLIVLSFYPQAIISYLEANEHLFKENQVITDVCGVKSSFVEEAAKKCGKAIYCSHHPMAGREKVGIEHSQLCVFEDANFLITPTEDTPQFAIDMINKMGVDLGFARFTIIDIKKHDRMIGFTSQLTHAIAVSLVNSDHDDDTINYIGDSYRDLTRIAMINESLWSELFLENKEYLFMHIVSFEMELAQLKYALANNDKEKLEELFKKSTGIRRRMEKQ